MKHYIVFVIVNIFLFCYADDLNAQWMKTNGPCGSSGSVASIAIIDSNIFATANGCIFRSTDKGNSWSLVYSTNSLITTNSGITSLAINDRYVYAGNTGMSMSGVLRSSDNGMSWPAVNGALNIYALCVSDSVVLASSAWGQGSAGMFRSVDNGTSWTQIHPSGVSSYAAQGSKIFAAVSNVTPDPYGVYFSNDAGATWKQTSFPTGAYSVAAHESNVFAGTDSCIYQSTNNGETWNTSKSGLSGVKAIVFSPSGSYIYAGTNNGVFRSTDHGAIWTSINTGLTTNRIYSLAVYPEGSADSSYVYAGTGGGIFRSSDYGTTWVVSGLPNHQFPPSMSLASSGSFLFAGAGYTKYRSNPVGNYENILYDATTVIFISTDNGSTWTESDYGITGMHAPLSSLLVNGSDIYAGTYPGGVFRSTNGGASWTNSRSGMNDTNVYALTSSGSDIIAGTIDGGVYVSTNNGLNWSAANSGLTDASIRALTSIGSNVYAGAIHNVGSIFNPIYSNDIFLTSNNGTSWAKIDSQSTPTSAALITCLSANGSNLVIGTGNKQPNPPPSLTWSPVGGVYRLTFDGAKWNRSDSALVGNYVTSFVSTGSNIFAGTYTGGVFASSNNSASWTSISDGLTDSSVVSLTIHNSNLFVATSSGVWKRPISEITSVPSPIGMLPNNYSLEQNYPNPFNPTTTIRYQLPNAGYVTLKVYDILGREVVTLVNEVKAAGSYSAIFDGDKLASGVYIARLIAQSKERKSFVQTMKMLMLK